MSISPLLGQTPYGRLPLGAAAGSIQKAGQMPSPPVHEAHINADLQRALPLDLVIMITKVHATHVLVPGSKNTFAMSSMSLLQGASSLSDYSRAHMCHKYFSGITRTCQSCKTPSIKGEHGANLVGVGCGP